MIRSNKPEDILCLQLHLPGGQLTQRDRLTVDTAGKTFDSSKSPKAACLMSMESTTTWNSNHDMIKQNCGVGHAF